MNCLLSLFKAYDQYLNLRIDRKKLVMGVPWYGYDYPCINLTQVRYYPVKTLHKCKRLTFLPTWLQEWQFRNCVTSVVTFWQTFIVLSGWMWPYDMRRDKSFTLNYAEDFNKQVRHTFSFTHLAHINKIKPNFVNVKHITCLMLVIPFHVASSQNTTQAVWHF